MKEDDAPEKMTKTKLYSEVHERLIGTYLRHYYESPEERRRKRCEIKQSLEKLAFRATEEEKFVFTVEELRECNITPDKPDVIRTGILTCCYHYDTDTRDEYNLYQFVHRSFCDYWYASYIRYNKTPEQQLKEWKEVSPYLNWGVFLCGLSEDESVLRGMLANIGDYFHPYDYIEHYCELPPHILSPANPEFPGWLPVNDTLYFLPVTQIENLPAMLETKWEVLYLDEFSAGRVNGYVKQHESGQHTGRRIMLHCHTLSSAFTILNELTQPITGGLYVTLYEDTEIDDKEQYCLDSRIRCQYISFRFHHMDSLEVMLSFIDHTERLVLYDYSDAHELPAEIVYKLCKVVTDRIWLYGRDVSRKQRYKSQIIEAGFLGNVRY